MTLNFPNSPSINQTHTGSNGIIYRYDGEKWITAGSSLVEGSPIFSGNVSADSLSVTSNGSFGGKVTSSSTQSSDAATTLVTKDYVGDGTITIVQPGTTNQTFSVNQSGNTTITLKNDTLSSGSYLRSDANDTASGDLTFNGKVNIRGNIDLADSDYLIFGNGDDIQIAYNSNGWLYFDMYQNGIIFRDTTSAVARLEDNAIFRPETNNSGQLGTSSYYWSNGYFSNISVSSTLNVRGAIDLADNDILRLGSGDDAEFFCNGSHFYLDLNSGIGNFYIRDGSTTRFTFDDAGHFTATGNIQGANYRIDQLSTLP